MRNRKVVWAIVALVVIGAVIGLVALNAGNGAPEVSTATVTKTDLSVSVSASGRIEADVRSDVYPVSAGTLATVYVKDGQAVKAGQLLAALDTEPLELQVEQARAGRAQAQAQVAQSSTGGVTKADKAAADANVAAARAGYEAALSAYNAAVRSRNRLPVAFRASAEGTVTSASVQVKQARAGLLAAQAQRDKLDANTAGSAVRSAALASRDQADQALEFARENLTKAKMVSPIDGVVVFNVIGTPGQSGEGPKAQAGAAVAPQVAPFTVVQLGALRFNADVDEVDIDKIKLGQKAEITLDAFPRDTFTSTISFIKSVSQQTATGGTVFPVHIALKNTGKNIKLGMKGDSTIEVSALKDTLTVPVESLLDDNGQSYVYVVEAETLDRVDVKVGALTDTEAEILEGLEEGDVVAISGETTLKDGMKVRVK